MSCLVLFWLLARARLVQNLLGVAISLYVALVMCGLNVWLLSPMYIAGCLLANPTLAGIVYAISPVIIMCLAYIVYHKLHRPIGMLACNLYGFLSLLPLMLVDMFEVNPIYLVLNVVVCQLVTFFCLDFLRGVCVRGNMHRLSTNECIGGVVLCTMLSLGLYSVDILGFRPYYVVLGVCCVLAIFKLPLHIAVVASFGISLGGSLGGLGLEIVGKTLAVVLAGWAFVKYNRYLAGSAVVLMWCLLQVYFEYFGVIDYGAMIGFSAGAVVCTILPKALLDRIPIYKQVSSSVSAKTLLDRAKSDLSHRVNGISKVFYEMADAYCHYSQTITQDDKAEVVLAGELMTCTCNKCERREECFRALGKQTSTIFESVISSGLATGRASLVDLPNFVNAHCNKIPQLLANTNSLVGSYLARRTARKNYGRDSQLMATQLAGVGGALGQLSQNLLDSGSVDLDMEDRLVGELAEYNIVCNEVMTMSCSGGVSLSMVIREQDKDNDMLIKVAQRVVGHRLQLDEEVTKIGENRIHINLLPAPKYNLTYGFCQQIKQGSTACGDIVKVIKIGGNKVLVALCDGMGSGENAQHDSTKAMEMVANYYKVGWDNARSLSLINRLLAVTSQDNFCALDMCVVDLDNALVDFIKLGGVESYIRRESAVEIVPAVALPMGIIEEANPQISRQMLVVGDMAVVVSDGINDILTPEGITLILDKIGSLNPQVVCDEIMGQAKRIGLQDDATVIAFRIFLSQ